MIDQYNLQQLETEEDWVSYHDIRRTILFEGRGHFGIYDPNHPDDRKQDHYPFLFLYHNQPIGTVRVDVNRSGQSAFMRLVAIIEAEQRKGHGAAMVQFVEEFALKQACELMQVVPADDAMAFYRKCGYRIIDPGSDPVIMRKHLV